MNYKITRTNAFVKTAKKFFKRHPQLVGRFKDVMLELEKNPFEPSLNTHKLKGTLKGKYGVSLDYKYRIVVTFQIQQKEIILWDIGSHDEAY